MSRGIPQSAAMLGVASLALNKIIAAFPEDDVEEGQIREIDAEELHRSASREDGEESERVVREAAAEEGKKGGCVIA